MTQNTLDTKGLAAAKAAYAETLVDDGLGDEAYVIRAYLAALREAPVPSEEPVAAINGSSIASFVRSYQFDASDEGFLYTPDFHEQCMLEDAICSFISDPDLLQAALASPAVAPVAVSVKGLEWQGSTQGAWARSVFGIYYVSALTQLMPTRIIFRWKLTVEGVYSNEAFETEEAAKAAAQSDFNARILSSILVAK